MLKCWYLAEKQSACTCLWYNLLITLRIKVFLIEVLFEPLYMKSWWRFLKSLGVFQTIIRRIIWFKLYLHYCTCIYCNFSNNITKTWIAHLIILHLFTGAGKTYTMLGAHDEPGIMAQALNDLFLEMDRTSQDMSYKVTMSYLEVCTTKIC